MFSNQLHINLTKSVYMHLRPYLNQNDRQTCARCRIEKNLKLGNFTMKKVKEVKFLGVIIDDELSWGPQINYLREKLISSIVIIKRIKKFIPVTEYLKLYNALFKSHISYCISSWGGIPKYKLNGLFSIQKRCIRLLFGAELTFDHAEYYETCARTRTYQQHKAIKNFTLEHTRPLFIKYNLLCLHHLHIYHTFIDLFKLLKLKIPISVSEIFKLSIIRTSNLLVTLPLIRTELAKRNFVFQASKLWNALIGKLMNECRPNSNGIMIPGSANCSDLSAPISVIKKKLRDVLLLTQKLDSAHQLGWRQSDEWNIENFFKH